MLNWYSIENYREETRCYFTHGRRFEESNLIKLGISLPRTGDPRSHSWPRFNLTLSNKLDVNLPKAGDLRSRTWLRFCLTLSNTLGVNLPKAGDPRSRTWLRLCLTLSNKLSVNLTKSTTIELINISIGIHVDSHLQYFKLDIVLL